nr:transmembrane protease serine 12-like isoform X2 [Zootoca vivipara]
MRRRLRPAFSLALLVLLYGPPPGARPSGVPTHVCGTRPLIDEKKTGTQIEGDHEAQLGAWPWLVSLQIYRVFEGGYRHKCGGSLISNNSVLTAARCIKKWVNPEYWRVVIGLRHLYKHHSHTINFRVRDIVVHSNFKVNSYDNDIALFELIKFVEYDEYIQPICLPDIPLLVTDKNPCYISGWEKKEEKGDMKYTLQESQVDIIPLYTCARHRWYSGHGISRDMICADSASGHKNTCKESPSQALAVASKSIQGSILVQFILETG